MARRGVAGESIWTWIAGGALVLAAAFVLALQTAPALGADGGHDHASHDHTTCTPIPGVPKLCSHGPDKAPAGVDPTRLPSRRELERRAATGSYDPAATTQYSASASTTPKVACIGDGTSGPRVQAIYARPESRPNRYSDVLPLIRKFAGLADSYVNRSASQVGTGRRIRFVTDDCKLKVIKVTLNNRGDDSFNDTVRQLANKGFNKSKRKYLIWMDSKVVCGVGSIFPDDRASLTNENNQITGFARVDRGCWGGGVEAHELFHTLGAVQQSAPHSTPAGHCFDEQDAMCYLDGTVNKMRSICPQAIQWQIDCNHDDYFNPKPGASNYLSDHWNTADSRFLEPTIRPPTPPDIDLPGRARRLPGLKWSLSATSKAAPKRTIDRWQWEALHPYYDQKATGCRFSGATTATPKFWCNATVGGALRIVATVWDNKGLYNVTEQNVVFATPSTLRPTVLAFSASDTSLPEGGGTVTLTAKLTDKETGKAIIGMPLMGSGYSQFGSTSLSGRTSTTGVRRWSRSVTATTDFGISSAQTGVWRGRSVTRTVQVVPPTATITVNAGRTRLSDGSVRVTGSVAPKAAAAALILERSNGGTWQPDWNSTVNPVWGSNGYTGAFTVTAVLGWGETVGTYSYRLRVPADSLYRAGSTTFSVTFTKATAAITVGPERNPDGFGGIVVPGSVTPAGAAGELQLEWFNNATSAWEYGGWVDAPWDSNTGQYTGQFSTTVYNPTGVPGDTETFRVTIPGDSTLWEATPQEFEVTFP